MALIPAALAVAVSAALPAAAVAQTRSKPADAGLDLTFALPARTASTPQGSVELIAASERPTAAGELWLALRYQLNPGWHIYWTNPGDSGGPPVVQWQLPAGAKAGPFEWPTPSRLPLEQLMNFGYEGIVVLPLKVTLPAAAAAAGKPLHVGAALKWLVCKDICVSGKADLGLDLPLAAADRPMAAAWADEIKTARASVPQPAPKTWRASARTEASDLVLTMQLDRPAPSAATFFPSEPNVIENAAPQRVTANGRELRIVLKKAERLTKVPPTLRGVLTFPVGAQGSGRTGQAGQMSVTIAAPVLASAAAGR